jgi:CHASE2 domain-containing sensor protein
MNHKIQNTSKSGSRKKLTAAYRAVYAIGVLHIFLGLLATIFGGKATESIVLAILFFVFGLLFILLGFFVQRKSTIALSIAVTIMVISALVGIYNVFRTGSPIGIIIPIAFLSQTWEGFKAIQELNRVN